MSIRAQQKLQTRQALLESARLLMNSGRGFGSLSLREVSRQAGIVPAGFYRHFADMESFGLALVAEVGDTFRDALRQVRHHELQQRGMIEASVEIFLGAVAAPWPCARPSPSCASASPRTWPATCSPWVGCPT